MKFLPRIKKNLEDFKLVVRILRFDQIIGFPKMADFQANFISFNKVFKIYYYKI